LKSIDATRIARELAEENLRNQQARYDVGLATTKDILDFQDQLTRARFLEVEALTQYNGDLAEMRRVDGTLLKARNVLIERVSPEKAPWWASF
jgi:outer membrane protein TolC